MRICKPWKCRTELIRKAINDDSIERACCPSCGWVHYPTNAFGVNVLITTKDGVVALLPPNAPKDFPAALPGGHGEYGESPEEAAIREAYEETGFHVEISRFLGWEFKKNTGYPGPMISFYFEARVIGGAMRESEEGRVAIYKFDKFPAIAPERGGSRKTMDLYREMINRTS